MCSTLAVLFLCGGVELKSETNWAKVERATPPQWAISCAVLLVLVYFTLPLLLPFTF